MVWGSNENIGEEWGCRMRVPVIGKEFVLYSGNKEFREEWQAHSLDMWEITLVAICRMCGRRLDWACRVWGEGFLNWLRWEMMHVTAASVTIERKRGSERYKCIFCFLQKYHLMPRGRKTNCKRCPSRCWGSTVSDSLDCLQITFCSLSYYWINYPYSLSAA